MERARKIWERLELPKLRPQEPWYGYNLGSWSEEDEEEAELALKGEHYQTGEKAIKKRVRVK
jgi:4-hydroxy-3-polyprenylbenzoate decarboxylase